MATDDRTHAGQPGPVLNYLGHPCHFAKLIERRADEPDRKHLKGKEPRWLTQHLGDKLGELDKRAGHVHNFVEQLARMVEEGLDHYELQSMVDVLLNNKLATSNLAYETTTVANATLDSAGLIAASQQQRAEVAHG